MSVVLLLTNDLLNEQKSVPLVTEAVFKQELLPGIEELNLDWLTMLGTGFDVNPENRPDVLNDLTKLRSWVATRGDRYEIVTRLNRVIEELTNYEFVPGAEAFLG